MQLHVTAIKRWTRKKGYFVIYQISNKKATARDHERFYSYRWNIEMFFRTAKQNLGLSDCQVRNINAQANHLKNVFLAYTILQCERKNKKLNNPEAALKRLKSKNYEQLIDQWSHLGQIFGEAHA